MGGNTRTFYHLIQVSTVSQESLLKPRIPNQLRAMLQWLSILLLLTLTSCTMRGQSEISAPPPGDYERSIDHGGRQRSYLAHLPPQASDGAPLPVVLNLHGGGGNGEDHKEHTGMDQLADTEGFIAIYPNGTGRIKNSLLTWNAGSCCGYSQEENVDDVAFIRALLVDLSQWTPIDSERVYATGLSNGAMMSYRLGAELSDLIAAIAPVAGSMTIPSIAASRAVPLMHIHSVDDPRALYAGGLGPPFPFTNQRVLHPSVEDTLEQWVSHNGCPEKPVLELTIQGPYGTEEMNHTATNISYGPCRDGVQIIHWKLTGAGHVWPGRESRLEDIVGPATIIIDANEEIWNFFQQFSLDPNKNRVQNEEV